MMKLSEFSGLNDDEIKRIMSVIERDFKLRQKESRRLEELKKVIRQERERVEYLACSKEFNYSRCIRCFKPFKIFLNPKELCCLCQLYVCHDCAVFNKQMKTWSCSFCLKLKELESLTGDWFYTEIEKKYKRCGSAKIIRELYKREKELSEFDEDLGYGTLPKSTTSDSKDSVTSYVIHDRNLRSELNEYGKRMSFLIDNLQSNLLEHDKRKVNLKDHLQQIISEISRARMALHGPLRHSNRKLNIYEIDLQNLLIHKTEEILQINLQDFQKIITTSNFDQKLAQIILDRYIKQEVPSTLPKLQQQQQLSIPLIGELKTRNDSIRRVNFSKTSPVNEEENDDDDDESQERTPTKNSMNNYDHRLIDTNLQTIKKSTERVADWKINCTLIETKMVSSEDNDERDEYTTWL